MAMGMKGKTLNSGCVQTLDLTFFFFETSVKSFQKLGQASFHLAYRLYFYVFSCYHEVGESW